MGESSYLILLAADTYDVPHRSRDDLEVPDASETVFRYFVCAYAGEGPHLPCSTATGTRSSGAAPPGISPSLRPWGFLFPAF